MGMWSIPWVSHLHLDFLSPVVCAVASRCPSDVYVCAAYTRLDLGDGRHTRPQVVPQPIPSIRGTDAAALGAVHVDTQLVTLALPQVTYPLFVVHVFVVTQGPYLPITEDSVKATAKAWRADVPHQAHTPQPGAQGTVGELHAPHPALVHTLLASSKVATQHSNTTPASTHRDTGPFGPPGPTTPCRVQHPHPKAYILDAGERKTMHITLDPSRTPYMLWNVFSDAMFVATSPQNACWVIDTPSPTTSAVSIVTK